MTHWLLIYAAVIGAILVMDFFWLGFIAKRFYADQLGDLKLEKFKAIPAAAFYLLYAAGLVILAVRPEQSHTPIATAAFHGAVVGFIAFGTYNTTNYATLKRWPIKMSAVDWPWGTFLSAIAATSGAFANTLLK